MKNLLLLTLTFFIASPLFSQPLTRQQALSDGNNISTWVWNTGVFNQDLRISNTPGFQWPKGSNKFAIFTSGLSIGAFVNDSLRLASVSYSGEYGPGHILNGVPMTSSIFKLYKVSRGDNNNTNPDYANWGLMVPYGAPFDDINNNGVYDAGTDKPGIKNAVQTIFVCLTDGFPETHSSSEGFSGGTAPLKAEMHLTAWSYDNIAGLEDVQFLKMEIINKNSSVWNKTHFGFVADPDLGYSTDDYTGCDISRNLGFCYNADNVDGTGAQGHYGSSPPAVGIDMLKGGVNRSTTPNTDMYMTSFTTYGISEIAVCENEPTGGPKSAYNYLRGLKLDSTKFVNPVTMQTTKYCYSGDPETASGWTGYYGKVNNCGGDTTGTIVSSMPGDKKFVMSSGASNFKIAPGEKQTFIFAQMMARGANNKNSVTKLKTLDDAVQAFYNNNLSVGINQLSVNTPELFSLHQNYPNPFNPSTNIKFDLAKSDFVSLKIFDIAGKEITTLVNESLKPGTYEVNFNAANLPSGIYFYQLKSSSLIQTKKMTLIK